MGHLIVVFIEKKHVILGSICQSGIYREVVLEKGGHFRQVPRTVLSTYDSLGCMYHTVIMYLWVTGSLE